MPAVNVMGLFPSFQPGVRLVDAGEVLQMARLAFSNVGGLVGTATAATAPIMSAHINTITGGGAASNVMLPPALPGTEIVVVNTQTTVGNTVLVNANILNPLTGVADTVAGGASVTLVINSSALFICYTLGRWVQYAGTGTT